MTAWYISSATWALVPTFAINTAYIIGDLVRQITPTQSNKHVWRCTTAGTSAGAEPTWTNADNDGQTIVSNTATFTCVTGRAAHGWSAAAGDHSTISGEGLGTTRFGTGDIGYLSSDHAETSTAITIRGGAATYTGALNFVSVNRAGSVPPVLADYLAGATLSTSAGLLSIQDSAYWLGCRFVSAGALTWGSAGRYKHLTIEDGLCSAAGLIGWAGDLTVNLNNTQLQFDSTARYIGQTTLAGTCNLEWRDTAVPIAGSFFPTQLFLGASSDCTIHATLRGLDLSALGSGTSIARYTADDMQRITLDSCKIDPAVVRVNGTPTNASFGLSLINCYDGTNVVNERYTVAGSVTTERTITLGTAANGANDGAAFSHKMVSGTTIHKRNETLDGFWLDVANTVLIAQTATVEIISSASLNDDEIFLDLEYYPTANSTLAGLVTTQLDVLGTAAAVTTSTAIWNSSPGTPVKQKLVASFTALTPGRLRGRVRLGKASATVYYNPRMKVA